MAIMLTGTATANAASIIVHDAATLMLSTDSGDLRIADGANIFSATAATFVVVMVGGTQTLTNKTLTGCAANTAAVDTNTTQIASTAFVLAQAASATPLVDGTGAVGTSTRYARGDHVHPTDTSRAPTASPTFTGTVTSPHFKGGGSTPTIAAGAGAGTSPTVSITGTDAAGQITLTSGTLPSALSAVFTVTFATTYGAAPNVVFSAANANAAALSGLTAVYVTSNATTFIFNSGATGISAALQFVWNYVVIG